MQAKTVKQKYNGSILKGTRMRIEEARPDKSLAGTAQNEKQPKYTNDTARNDEPSKKRKRDTIAGYALSPERKVRRGWTEPLQHSKEEKKLKKRKIANEPSKYTDKAECLFRASGDQTQNRLTAEKDVKSLKKARKPVVHEFEKTLKHSSFLRSQAPGSSKPSVEYISGKGWVDDDGNVVESTSLPSATHGESQNERSEIGEGGSTSSSAPSSSNKSSSEDSSLGDNARLHISTHKIAKSQTPSAPEKAIITGSNNIEDETSSEGSSSENDDTSSSDSSSESGDEKTDIGRKETSDVSANRTPQLRSKKPSDPLDSPSSHHTATTSSSDDNAESSASEPVSPSQSLSPSRKYPLSKTTSPTPIKAVHPLEALYKRPPPSTPSRTNHRPAPLKTTFNFFDPSNDVEEGAHVEEQMVTAIDPQTPYTLTRRARSAAPTPDTAAPSKAHIQFFPNIDKEDAEMNDNVITGLDGEDPRNTAEQTLKEEESGFVKWFWENRGDNNRAWKRRRREAAKEKRQRDNKRRGRNSGI